MARDERAISSIKDYLSLLKLKVVGLLVVVAGITATVANGGFPPLDRLLLLSAAGTLSSAGATALNHYIDRDIDAIMERTRKRPLPSGRIRNPQMVLLLGLLLVALSLPFSLQLNYQVSLYTLAGAFIYVVVYTLWLKRRHFSNIVIGGLAGSCAAAAGWATASPQISLVALLIALLVFLWTPTHFWSFALVHKESYRQAAIPMMPVVVGEKGSARYILLNTLLIVLVSLLLYFRGPFSSFYLMGALLLGGLFLALNLQLFRDPARKVAWNNYKFSGIYLLGLFLIMFLDIVW